MKTVFLTLNGPPYSTPEVYLQGKRILELLSEGGEVGFIGIEDHFVHRRKDTRFTGLFESLGVTYRAGQPSRIVSIFRLFVGVVFPIPDRFWPYALPLGKAYLSYLKSGGRADRIIIWGQPHSIFFILRLVRRFSPSSTKIISHVSDPVGQSVYSNPGRLNQLVLKAIRYSLAKFSDEVELTSRLLQSQMMAEQRDYSSKYKYRPHASPALIVDRLNLASNREQDFGQVRRVVLVGNFYGPRRIDQFLKLLDLVSVEDSLSLSRYVVVEIYGNLPRSLAETKRIYCRNFCVKLNTGISYIDSLELMGGAYGFLNIDPEGDEPYPFVPSKIADYSYFKKPIFLFGQYYEEFAGDYVKFYSSISKDNVLRFLKDASA